MSCELCAPGSEKPDLSCSLDDYCKETKFQHKCFEVRTKVTAESHKWKKLLLYGSDTGAH